jgi:hypothetical protein
MTLRSGSRKYLNCGLGTNEKPRPGPTVAKAGSRKTVDLLCNHLPRGIPAAIDYIRAMCQCRPGRVITLTISPRMSPESSPIIEKFCVVVVSSCPIIFDNGIYPLFE